MHRTRHPARRRRPKQLPPKPLALRPLLVRHHVVAVVVRVVPPKDGRHVRPWRPLLSPPKRLIHRPFGHALPRQLLHKLPPAVQRLRLPRRVPVRPRQKVKKPARHPARQQPLQQKVAKRLPPLKAMPRLLPKRWPLRQLRRTLHRPLQNARRQNAYHVLVVPLPSTQVPPKGNLTNFFTNILQPFKQKSAGDARSLRQTFVRLLPSYTTLLVVPFGTRLARTSPNGRKKWLPNCSTCTASTAGQTASDAITGTTATTGSATNKTAGKAISY